MTDQVIKPTGWKKLKTENGNFLVRSPEGDVFYADPDGTLLKEIEDSDKEWNWALSTWNNKEILNPKLDFVVTLQNELKDTN